MMKRMIADHPQIRKIDDRSWGVYSIPTGWRRWFPGSAVLQGTYPSAIAAARAAMGIPQRASPQPEPLTQPTAALPQSPTEWVYLHPQGVLRTEPYEPPSTGVLGYRCPVHGDIGTQTIQSTIQGAEGVWCMVCIVEKLDELGIRRASR